MTGLPGEGYCDPPGRSNPFSSFSGISHRYREKNETKSWQIRFTDGWSLTIDSIWEIAATKKTLIKPRRPVQHSGETAEEAIANFAKSLFAVETKHNSGEWYIDLPDFSLLKTTGTDKVIDKEITIKAASAEDALAKFKAQLYATPEGDA